MKKIFLLIMIFISAKVFGQFPSEQSMASPKTQVYSKGSFGSDSGFIYRSCFTDTIQANRGFIKNIPGIKIRTCDDNEWMRNNIAVKWILTGSSSGFINPMTTFGDMIVGKNFGVPIRIAQTELNAKQFGVVGDGVTDDADSLQKFFNYCVNNNVNGIIPGGQYKITKTLYIGDSTTASDPYKQTSITIRGVGPSKDPDDISADNHGTLILLTGTGKEAIVSFEKGASRYVKLKDLTVSCVTEGGAEYGLRFRGTFFSQHEIDRVHSFRAVKAFGITNPGNAGSNGEFTTFYKCVGSATTNFFYMDSLSGQGFEQVFFHCNGVVKDGGTYFDIGNSTLAYSLTAYSFSSSMSTPGTPLANQTTFLKTRGTGGNIAFYGGRNENISTILENTVCGTYTQSPAFLFSNVDFEGTQSTTSRYTLKGCNEKYIANIRFQNCIIRGKATSLGSGFRFSSNLGAFDESQYLFDHCQITNFDSLDIIESDNPKVQFDECRYFIWNTITPTFFSNIPAKWNATNYIGIVPGNTAYMAGNVGINKLIPVEKLDVTGNIQWSGALKPGGSAGTNGYFLTSTGGSANTWTNPSSITGLAAGNYGNIQLNRNSLLAAPGSDSLNFNGGLFIKGSSEGISADDNYFSFDANASRVGFVKKAGQIGYLGYGSANGLGVFQSNGTTISAGGTFTLRAIFATNGFFGINNSSPSYRLDVNGSARVIDTLLTGGVVRLYGLPTTAKAFVLMADNNGYVSRVDTTGLFGGGGGGSGTPGGSSTQMQYNNAGAFAGTSGATATATQVTLVSPIIDAAGTDATGDLYYRNSSNELLRLAIGTSKQTLHVVSGVPAWRDTVTLDFDSIGTYTPTLYNTTNVTTSTAYPTMWQTQGGGIRITVTGQVLVDPSSTGAVVLGIEIPFATSLAQNYSLNGVAVSEITGEPAYITADTTNNRALLQFTATSTASRTYKFTFTYDYAPS